MHLQSKHLTLALLGLTLVFTSCKKDDKKDNVDYSAEVAQHNDDASRMSNEIDAVSDDANLVIESEANFVGKEMSPMGLICDATVTVNTSTSPKSVTIVYNGSNCGNGRIRTGTVTMTLTNGTYWKDQGAVLTVNYQSLKVKRLSDNKSIVLNGTTTITNVTGGKLANLALGTPITHRISSSNMSLFFDDSTTRTWSVGRQRTFSYNNGAVVSITGTHSANGINGIAEWGVNRFGNNFTTAITSPMIVRQDCNFRITGGSILHSGLAANTTVDFGLNAQGQSTGCPGATGQYYLKLTWTGAGGNSLTLIRPY